MTKSRPAKTFHITLICCLLFLMNGCESQQESKGVSASPHVYDGTIIALGDSLTAGLGVSEKEAWPALLKTALQQSGNNWQVINAGVSGETSSGALARIKWILSHQPDIVILETGANDGLRGIPIEVLRKNLLEAIRMLQEANVTVLLAGMEMVRNMGDDYASQFAAVYPEAASEMGVLLIPFLLENVAGKKELNLPDAIHPNEAGHQIIAGTVFPFVLQAISRRTSKEETGNLR